MRRLLNKSWFSTSLALLAILLIGWRLLPVVSPRFEASRAGAASETTAAVDSAAAPITAPASISALLSDLPGASSARDPFALRAAVHSADEPRTKVPDLVDTLHLSALWTEHAATLVLINGRIWQLGDTIGHLRIAAASQDGVWVTHGTGRDFIPLGGDFTLRTPVPPASVPVALN